MNGLPLLLADGAVRTTFEWGRIQSNADWVFPIAVCVALMLFVRWMYRRDAVELHPALGWLLTLLRTAAIFGLLVLYLQPQWRLERQIVRNSRAVLLIDTSLSMGLRDTYSRPASAAPAEKNSSRIAQVAAMLKETDFLDQLRRTHDVSLFQFNDDLSVDRSLSFKKQDSAEEAEQSEAAAERPDGAAAAPGETAAAAKPFDWNKFLAPAGRETRLGQALRQLLNNERGAPLSGVILFSDGGQNAGITPEAAVTFAQEMKLPIFTVGLGSEKQPVNVSVSDLTMPARAYPGDRYTVTGYLQAQHLGGEVATVEVLSRPAGGPASEEGTGVLLDTRQVTLGGDGEVLPVKFELTPEETGRSTICFRVQPPLGDRNLGDNFREDDLEIVDRKNRVLLLAGGPAHEYQFLRSLLYRDRSTQLDILLQSAPPGVSQEGNLLDAFPATREEMFAYDCLVAFDADWQQLSPGQVELLETWVADQGGGMIVVAGSFYAGKSVGGWVQDPALKPIRNLYPVQFPRRMLAMENLAALDDDPCPLDFTREGLEASFLWLGDSAVSGRQAWAGFPGVFSYTPVRGAKPGAAVYARLADPRLGTVSDAPIYFAGQFYGSGSVFYLGSGEMWRLRELDESYFEQFYTKLIRHVSQGRLLRGSTRGVLLVGQDRCLLGHAVEVRAQLSNARMEPLRAPSVPLQVIAPDGTMQTIALRADPSREGTFTGQFPALQVGKYRLELPVPESDSEQLTRRVQVSMPQLERQRPQRDDALLSAIAEKTGGKYYVGIDSIFDARAPLVAEFKDRTTTITQTDDPHPEWERQWLRWMMVLLCGLLCLEWLIRRLVKLA